VLVHGAFLRWPPRQAAGLRLTKSPEGCALSFFHQSRDTTAIDGPFEIETMAAHIQILSKNVRTKHRAVNAGFVLAAMTLVLFFFAGLSYLARSVW
jgi:hypothetical protein